MEADKTDHRLRGGDPLKRARKGERYMAEGEDHSVSVRHRAAFPFKLLASYQEVCNLAIIQAFVVSTCLLCPVLVDLPGPQSHLTASSTVPQHCCLLPTNHPPCSQAPH